MDQQTQPMQNKADINPECCCFNLRKITRAVTQMYDKHLEPAGIRATQFTLLVALAESSAKTLTEIAESLVMDRTTLTRNLKPLEKLGLISTVQPMDKRSKAYVLTEKGKETVEKGIPYWRNAQQHIMGSMGQDKYHALLGDLDKMLGVTSSSKVNNKKK